jgi:hypothetical protein
MTTVVGQSVVREQTDEDEQTDAEAAVGGFEGSSATGDSRRQMWQMRRWA